MIKPDFNKLLKVFKHVPQEDPVVFEFVLNEKLYNYLAGDKILETHSTVEKLKIVIKAHFNAGYDYATVPASYTNTFSFTKGEVETMETKSLNSGFLITNREEFNNYQWTDPDKGDYNFLMIYRNTLTLA